jgi:hypothetical protein
VIPRFRLLTKEATTAAASTTSLRWWACAATCARCTTPRAGYFRRYGLQRVATALLLRCAGPDGTHANLHPNHPFHSCPPSSPPHLSPYSHPSSPSHSSPPLFFSSCQCDSSGLGCIEKDLFFALLRQLQVSDIMAAAVVEVEVSVTGDLAARPLPGPNASHHPCPPPPGHHTEKIGWFVGRRCSSRRRRCRRPRQHLHHAGARASCFAARLHRHAAGRVRRTLSVNVCINGVAM